MLPDPVPLGPEEAGPVDIGPIVTDDVEFEERDGDGVDKDVQFQPEHPEIDDGDPDPEGPEVPPVKRGIEVELNDVSFEMTVGAVEEQFHPKQLLPGNEGDPVPLGPPTLGADVVGNGRG